MPRAYRPHAALAASLRDSGVPIRRDDAIAKFGPHALRACLSNGSVVRILPKVYCAKQHCADAATRARAASMWAEPAGALTGAAALWAWGVLDEAPDVVTVHLPLRARVRVPPWLRPWRGGPLPDTFRVNRMRVVSLNAALVRAWGELSRDRGIAALVSGIGTRSTAARSVLAEAARTPTVRARRELAAVLTLLDGGVTSYLEYVARKSVFPASHFPELAWQVPVRARDRQRVLDVFCADARLALEFDGASSHAGFEQRAADLERDAELATIGIAVLRFTYEDIMRRPKWCREIYRATRAARS